MMPRLLVTLFSTCVAIKIYIKSAILRPLLHQVRTQGGRSRKSWGQVVVPLYLVGNPRSKYDVSLLPHFVAVRSWDASVPFFYSMATSRKIPCMASRLY